MNDSLPAPEPRAAHVPVLLGEVLEWLDPRPGQVVVDGTVGAGGHARAILPRIQPGGRLIGLDRDPTMLNLARQHLPEPACTLIHASYARLREVLTSLRIPEVDAVLVDLGVSSDQLADPQRGFGFESQGLDMRFDPTQGRTARDLLNRAPQEELARIFFEYGQERFSRRIARRIVESRPIESAAQLAETVRRALPRGRPRQRIHPATRVFQALRIAVNDELGALETLLQQQLPASLRAGGRTVVISFHSLEDRIVKQSFRDRSRWQNLTRKPVTASAAEVRRNPRARSARLRSAVWLGSGKAAGEPASSRARENSSPACSN